MELDRTALAVVRRNAATVGAAGVVVRGGDAWRLPRRSDVVDLPEPADLVLLDPPYREADARIDGLLAHLVDGGWLAPAALAVVERPARGQQFDWPRGWEPVMDRRYANTHMHVGRLVASA